ncbi:unnamed protein product [Symbiodinium natans]|uniref:TauD/TfdA-like domain-containing protein n=1 Tax=Symbiodinium natans TaxID=878477 RepID=A0A812H945_9DINO|nr:unnamed protein product [Symbiodinium natans]
MLSRFLRVWGLGVWGLGFRVWGSGFPFWLLRGSYGGICVSQVFGANVGAVLIKAGGQIPSTKEFETLAVSTWQAAGFPDLGIGNYNKFGTVQRSTMGEGIYDVAAGAPPHLPVSPHSEQAYLHQVPRFCSFVCQRPADVGGELQLFDNVVLGEELGDLTDKLARLGVTYFRVMGDQVRSANWSYATGMWQDRFATPSWAEAKSRAGADVVMGGSSGAQLGPGEEGTVVLNWTVPAVTWVTVSSDTCSSGVKPVRAVLQSILDNHKSVNYGTGIPALHSTWGDGTDFDDWELEVLRKAVAKSLWASMKLEEGDVVVVDNWHYAHGRSPYEGQRKHAALISDRFPRA